MSNSTNITGTITVRYQSREICIPYSMDLSPGYGGLPLMSVEDKHGHSHTFVRSEQRGTWAPVGRGPKWPEGFVQLLYKEFEEAYKSAINHH